MALSGEFWMQFLISFILAFVFLHLLNAPLASIQILFCFILAFDLFGVDFNPAAHFLLFEIFPPLRIFFGRLTHPLICSSLSDLDIPKP
jgi:hypothetical protein